MKMIDSNNLYEIIYKINGQILPVGCSNRDEARYENLTRLIDNVDMLIGDLIDASGSKNSHEASVKKIGCYSDKYLRSLYIRLQDRYE